MQRRPNANGFLTQDTSSSLPLLAALLTAAGLSLRAACAGPPEEGLPEAAGDPTPVFAPPSAPADRRGAPSPDPSILLVTIDTLRPDHLSGYGYHRRTSPHLDRLAREGHLFRGACSPIPITLPAHVGLLTARRPRTFGVIDNGAALPAGALTLAEILREQGFRTAALVSAFPVHSLFGLDQGFEIYSQPEVERRAGELLAEAAPLFERWAGERFFVWLHLYDPHTPYCAPREFRGLWGDPALELPKAIGFLRPQARVSAELVEKTTAAYDGEIAYADHMLGRLWAFLRRLGLDERLLIVVASDHGESLAELLPRYRYAFDHGEFLYLHQLSVPLLFRFPRSADPLAGSRSDRPAGLLDVMPTLLDYLGLPAPPEIEGRSLLRAAGDGETPPPALFGERRPMGPAFKTRLPLYQYSILHGGWHLIEDRQARGLGIARSVVSGGELYDLEADPGETVDLYDAEPGRVSELMEALERWHRAVTPPPEEPSPPALDPEVKRKLEQLGYVD